uniref:Nudix hydrolase domain-containing protein n=1 Tax=Caenorhabditis tropicalis TaxID=1561998 RepID=A0A1I7UBJ7_9PELO
MSAPSNNVTPRGIPLDCPYEVEAEKVVGEGKWTKYLHIPFKTKNGHQGVLESIHRKTKPPGAAADGVSILARVRKQGKMFIVLVKQYRVPCEKFTLEIPAGLIDAGETVRDAALRELKEETGYTASKVVKESKLSFMNPGLTDDSLMIVIVDVDGDAPENQNPTQKLDSTESIEVILAELDQFLQRCAAQFLMSDPFAPEADVRQPDTTYLAALEKRLKAVKDKKNINSKSIIKDIESLKNDRLFEFLSGPEPAVKVEEKFDDDFVPQDKPIKPSLLRQKVAPQTCAVNKNELAPFLKFDFTQKLYDTYRQFDFVKTPSDHQEVHQVLQDLNVWVFKKRRGTSDAFEKCVRAHVLPRNPWESANYMKTPQITAVLSFDGNLALTTDKRCRKSQWKVVNLVKLLPMEPENRGSLYELGCCDLSLETSGDCLAILAVFWIELNTNNVPAKCFGSIYRISKKQTVVFCKLIPTPSMVACCRLTDRKSFTADHHCLLVFSKDAQVSAYRVEANYIKQIEDVFEWFPSLALTNLPGGTLRTSCKICNTYRYSAVGLDTGVLIVSVCMIEGNVILDSVRLRFASPISVVEFLPQVSNNVQRLLVSSFMGPAGIWRLKFVDEKKLHWEEECIFERSQYYDSILSACIYRFYHGAAPRVMLGTYSGRILQYELPPPTKFVRRSTKHVPKCAKPINLLINHGIYFIKQTGFNEISAVTPFGLYVLRENFHSHVKRLGKFGQFWMNRQQNTLVVQNPNLIDDYTAAELRRLSIDSVNEQVMRPRVGSTVSQLTYRCSDEENLLERRRQTLGAKDYQRGATTSASGSSNGSSTRLRQLDVNITDQYYQDGPSDPLHSPNRAAQRVSALSHELHPQSPLANGDLRPQPVFFRALNKSISSPKSTKPHK